MDAKRLLRSRLIAARAERPPAEIVAAGAALAHHCVAAFGDTTTVAAFAGVGTEPPTRELLDGLRASGVTVLLPIVGDLELRWAPYEGWDDLVPAKFGLREPRGPGRAEGMLDTVDVLLVPALAVDRRGNRIGRGQGHFDRALAEVEPDRIVAVVFDDEVLDDVPVESHDRQVGAALTPSGLRRLTPMAT
jgi:5-formyltetrahydrofolate cyclo-ligase